MVHLSPEVAAARAGAKPLVALESTLIAHGMPWPHNLELALQLEAEIHKMGAIPATCAVINGKMKAGLVNSELEDLARQGQKYPKISRRDMAYTLSQGLSGATTVASTMMIAEAAGIRVFATGGIGGVHRGAGKTMDVSADLYELMRTPVAVVSAGAKAILDLGLTLEYLETLGVPVIGYKTNEFPAFYSRSSGHKLHTRLDSPSSIGKLLRAQWDLPNRGGVLIANPIPAQYALDSGEIEKAIESALENASQEGIKGKELTPYLLAHIKDLTKGRSLDANKALVLNNARLAAEIAVEL